MLTIYKKELRSYFHSMMAYLFLAFFTAFAGIYYTFYCLNYGVTNYSAYVLPGLTILFIVMVPILSMRLIAEEKKQKTDQLLFTCPIKVSQIVVGKYLAVCTLFLLALLIAGIFPVITSLFGKVSFQLLVTGFFGYFLLGAALIAIGLFISSLTENTVVAAVVCFAVVMAVYLMDSIVMNLPGRPRYTLAFLGLVLIGFVWLFLEKTKSKKWAAGVFVTGAISIIGLYVLKPTLFENGIASIFSWFSVLLKFNDFTDGILNLSSIIYYFSFIFVFLFLTVRVLKRDNRRTGMFSAVSIVTVLLVTLVINIGVTKADLSYDITSNQMYSISSQSKKILEDIKQPVTIYMLNSKTNANSLYQTILEQYPKHSNQIKLEYKDLSLYPNFANSYLADGQEVSADSVIVESGKKYRYVDSQEFINYSVDYTTYSQTADSINVEPSVTEAINYVTAQNTPVIYQLTGHGETSLGATATKQIQNDNYELKDLNLLTQASVPEDAQMLLINGPTSDLSKTDMAKIEAFAKEGNLYVLLDPMSDKLPNLSRFLKDNGVEPVNGFVVESDMNHYVQSAPNYLLPVINSHTITDSIKTANMSLVLPMAQGLKIKDKEGLTITSLLDTSDGAYSKADINTSTAEKTKEDIEGPFSLAALVENGKGQLIVSSCTNSIVDEADVMSSGANNNFFLNGINYLNQQESKISIRAKAITEDYATYNAFTQKVLSALAIFILPSILIGAGIIVILKRRRL